MATAGKPKSVSSGAKGKVQHHHFGEAATEALYEGKKMANELYDIGREKINGAQDSAKQYTDELAKKVKDKPITSLLIAGGVGFLLSSLFRK